MDSSPSRTTEALLLFGNHKDIPSAPPARAGEALLSFPERKAYFFLAFYLSILYNNSVVPLMESAFAFHSAQPGNTPIK